MDTNEMCSLMKLSNSLIQKKILKRFTEFLTIPAFIYVHYLKKVTRQKNLKKNIAELLCVIDTELFLQRRKYVHDWKQSRKPKRTIPFHWTGKMVDLVELLYALDTCDCINNGEIGVEELADALSEIFGVEIKNCYNVYMTMKRRKDDNRTYFLDELREKLNKRMRESDLKSGKFKKR